MKKILCIEDGYDTQLILKSSLKGFDVRFASTLKEAADAIMQELFDLIVIDISLPDGSGLDFFADYSDHLASLPVVFLSVTSSLAAKASAFTLGAEDFVVKPFDPKELRLRIEARLRKAQPGVAPRGVVCVGQLVCNLAEQRAYRLSQPEDDFHLTALEFRILVMLARTPNRVYTRAEIINRVWADSNATERSVDVHVSHIRKKIASTGVDISPVVGAGYRLAHFSK